MTMTPEEMDTVITDLVIAQQLHKEAIDTLLEHARLLGRKVDRIAEALETADEALQGMSNEEIREMMRRAAG